MNKLFTMTTEIVRMITDDGLELHGLLFLPKGKTASTGIIHLHGLAGNFYENRFVYSIAQQAVQKGMAFFTFNNRGHDYISDINKETEDGCDSIKLGGAYELVSECVHDINAAIEFLQNQGIKWIFLQGHSSGANKIVLYQSQVRHKSIKGLVLISPCDDVALQHEATKERAGELLELAQKLVSEGKGSQLMPEGSFYSYPFSAKTFCDYFGHDAKQDVFPYRNPDNEFKALASIEVPILVTFGEKGDAILVPIEEACELLKRKATHCPSLRCIPISGASHSYLGREMDLATQIVNWAIKL